MPSAVIASMNYDPESMILHIEYVSGMVYRYKNVPEKVYTELRLSGSKGRYLNQHIKRKYGFEKVDTAI